MPWEVRGGKTVRVDVEVSIDDEGTTARKTTVTTVSFPDAATVSEMLDWVGSDTDRAAAAIAFEQSKTKPRSTLLEALQQIE